MHMQLLQEGAVEKPQLYHTNPRHRKMKIKHLTKDQNWVERLESLGYGYHTDGNQPYWIDHSYYSIYDEVADQTFKATQVMWQMCLEAVPHVIDHKKYLLFQIPPYFH